MRWLAAYILRGPWQATLTTAATASLALLLPPFGYLSGAAVGLVTLRLGARDGVRIIAFSWIASGLFAFAAFGTPLPSATFAVVLWLPVWLTAFSLQRTASLARSVLLAGVMAMTVVVALHLSVADLPAWWRALLTDAFGAGVGESVAQLPERALALMTGLTAAALGFGVIGSLFLARWWQALLYNPGGFGESFRALRLGRMAGGVALLLLLLARFGGPMSPLAIDLLLVAAFLFLLQGLAVAHGLAAKKGAHPLWMGGVYLLLLLLPQAMPVLSLLGLADNWFDFRSFFTKNAGR